MVIHIERTGFFLLGRIFINDSKSEISRFVKNMPAHKSVLSGFKTETWHADFTMKHNEYAHHLITQYWVYVWTVSIPEYLDLSETSPLRIYVLVHLDFLT